MTVENIGNESQSYFGDNQKLKIVLEAPGGLVADSEFFSHRDAEGIRLGPRKFPRLLTRV